MRLLPIGIGLALAMVLGGLVFAVYTGRAQVPGDPPGLLGVDVGAAQGRFTQQHALAVLEERVRQTCAQAHPAALAQELARARNTEATQQDDHWRFDVRGSDWLYAEIYPDGSIAGTLLQMAARECGQ
ncbi:MAG: hypothetical protein QW838_05870 [Candidatus Nitrosotenuis sp.]